MSETLCASCDIEVFKNCPYVHYRGCVEGMERELICDEKVSYMKVTACPDYIKEKSTRQKEIRCICKACGVIFYADYYRASCSEECRKALMIKNRVKNYKWNKKKYVCQHCKKEFYSDSYKKYCSDECKERSSLKPYVCENCNRTFYARFKKKYCSSSCRRKAGKESK